MLLLLLLGLLSVCPWGGEERRLGLARTASKKTSRIDSEKKTCVPNLQIQKTSGQTEE
jgi:hypothetical protein